MFADNSFSPLQLLVFIANHVATPFHFTSAFPLVRVGALRIRHVQSIMGFSTID